MGDEDRKQFNIYLPEGLIREVKIASVNARLSLSGYVEGALRQHLQIEAEARRAGDEAAREYAKGEKA